MIKRRWIFNPIIVQWLKVRGCLIALFRHVCKILDPPLNFFFFLGGRCYRWLSVCSVYSANQPYGPWPKELNLHIVSAQYAWKKLTLKTIKERNITFVETYKHIKCILVYIAKVESTNHGGQLAFSENITHTNQKQMSHWHEHKRLHLKLGENTKWSQNCSATGYQWKTGFPQSFQGSMFYKSPTTYS